MAQGARLRAQGKNDLKPKHEISRFAERDRLHPKQFLIYKIQNSTSRLPGIFAMILFLSL